jgi:hypothetical protein
MNNQLGFSYNLFFLWVLAEGDTHGHLSCEYFCLDRDRCGSMRPEWCFVSLQFVFGRDDKELQHCNVFWCWGSWFPVKGIGDQQFIKWGGGSPHSEDMGEGGGLA